MEHAGEGRVRGQRLCDLPVLPSNPGRLDHWWTTTEDGDATAQEIARCLDDYALPFLERFESKEALLTHLLSEERPAGVLLHPSVCRAIVMATTGRREEAAAVLRERAAMGGHLSAAALTVAKRLGIALP